MNYKRLFIENSIVFITVITSKRRPILIKNIELVKNALLETKKQNGFQVIAICILPDHLHMLIKPDNIKDYPFIVKKFKAYFSKYVDISAIDGYEVSNSKIAKNEKDIWQRRYWEHTIRDTSDFEKHFDYIHYNPVKHGYIQDLQQWEYSTFGKYHKLGYYGNNTNFEDIKDLNYD